MRRTRGFTLMELVVAMALGLILLYVVYVSLDSASRATNQTLSQVNVHTRGRAIMELLQKDIETLVPPGSRGAPFTLTPHRGSSDTTIEFVRAAAEATDADGDPRSEFVRVRYTLDTGTSDLKRRTQPLSPSLALMGTEKTQTIDLNCTQFTATAWGDVIEVEFTVQDSAAGTERDFFVLARRPGDQP
jgi:prepilin-type N-terminal cleavage/methylation domain-containing protein